jgi:hypothetical protein
VVLSVLHPALAVCTIRGAFNDVGLTMLLGLLRVSGADDAVPVLRYCAPPERTRPHPRARG